MAMNSIVSRRRFLKASGMTALAASSGVSLPFAVKAQEQSQAPSSSGEEKVVWSACTVNCASRCPLRMHVKANQILYVETDNT